MQIVWKHVVAGAAVAVALGAASPAGAQTSGPGAAYSTESRWSADVGFGLDNSISGQLSISNRVMKFDGSWKEAGDNKYALNFNTPVRKLAITGAINENRMVSSQDKFTGLFDKLP